MEAPPTGGVCETVDMLGEASPSVLMGLVRSRESRDDTCTRLWVLGREAELTSVTFSPLSVPTALVGWPRETGLSTWFVSV